MNAVEAKRISEENKRSLEQAMKDIEGSANRGEQQLPLFGKCISDDTRLELMRLGYKINIFSDPMGVESYMINW